MTVVGGKVYDSSHFAAQARAPVTFVYLYFVAALP